MAHFYVLVCCERMDNGEVDRSVEGVFHTEALAVKAIPYLVPSFRNARTARLPPIYFMVQDCNLNEIMVFDKEYEGLMDISMMAYTGDDGMRTVRYYDIQGYRVESVFTRDNHHWQDFNDQLDGYGRL